MTRPEQPLEYGVRRPTERVSFAKLYTDLLGRRLSGHVIVRAGDDSYTQAPVLDGILELDLKPGIYRLITVLAAPDGPVQHDAETVVVEES